VNVKNIAIVFCHCISVLIWRYQHSVGRCSNPLPKSLLCRCRTCFRHDNTLAVLFISTSTVFTHISSFRYLFTAGFSYSLFFVLHMFLECTLLLREMKASCVPVPVLSLNTYLFCKIWWNMSQSVSCCVNFWTCPHSCPNTAVLT
jgi:hypothetical protein